MYMFMKSIHVRVFPTVLSKGIVGVIYSKTNDPEAMQVDWLLIHFRGKR
jgi:hypothetical protein